MNRSKFIKSSSLLGLGLALNQPNFLNFLVQENFTDNRLKLSNNGVRDMTLDEELIMGWLFRTVGSALISSLVGKIVDNYTNDNCYCNGTSCSSNNANYNDYSNTIGYYGYQDHSQRFLTQNINDRNVSFGNVSVAFVNRYNTHLTNVEGPFLAGLCYAAMDINKVHGSNMARNVVLPVSEISNGGYRFDRKPCYPTAFKTGYGKTEISYSPQGEIGYVKVDAYNRTNRLDYSEMFKINSI
jgi:hypothetical protein